MLLGLALLLVFLVRRSVFEDVSRLTFERLADGIERREPDAPDLARLETGEVDGGDADMLGELEGGHLPVGEHAVEPHDDSHVALKQSRRSRPGDAPRTRTHTKSRGAARQGQTTSNQTWGLERGAERDQSARTPLPQVSK